MSKYQFFSYIFLSINKIWNFSCPPNSGGGGGAGLAHLILNQYFKMSIIFQRFVKHVILKVWSKTKVHIFCNADIKTLEDCELELF